MSTKNICTWSTSTWYKRRFGEFLEKLDAHEHSLVKHPSKVVFVDNDRDEKENCNDYNSGDRKPKVVGLYFVPVSGLHTSVKYLNEDVTDDLKELYAKANDNVEENRRFEVVQICFPQKAPCLGEHTLSEQLKKESEDRYMDVPWFALPVDRIERAIRIRHYYGIRDGEFALVLVDASSGKLITRQGYERLLQYRTVNSFQWTSQDVLQILKSIPRYFLNSTNDFKDQSTDSRVRSFQDIDRNAVIGLYFSAHWCPPCKAFTSQLIETYNAIREAGRKFEIVLVSSDRSSDSYAHYVSKMPWLAIPYEDNDSRAQLTSLFGIQGIPSLILLNPDGSVITEDGRGEVNEDPKGLNFPWYQKSVNILTPRLAAKLQKNPAIVLFTDGEEDVEIELASAVLTPVSEYVRKKYDDELLFFIAIDSDTSDGLREYLQLDDVSPLVTLIDIPLARYTIMEYGKEITEKAIINLVNQFYGNELIFSPIY